MKKLLIMGLPGAGKTTLAKALGRRLNAVHFNADEVRAHVNKDLGFSETDRIEHAARMGWLCDQVVRTGGYAIADFICPTAATREAFQQGGDAFVIFVDRIDHGRFADTNAMFERPARFDLHVRVVGTSEFWAEKAVQKLRPVFDPRKPTALFVGRYQPFHAGHQALIEEGLRRVGQAAIAVRNTHGDEQNPFPFEDVRARIEAALKHHEGQFQVLPLPNITAIYFGRDVGYKVERIDVEEALQLVSATEQRRLIMPAEHHA